MTKKRLARRANADPVIRKTPRSRDRSAVHPPGPATSRQLALGYTVALKHLARVRRQRDALKQLNAELLAALKHAIAVDAEWRREHGDPVRTPEYQESYDMALAAIAKAEGHR